MNNSYLKLFVDCLEKYQKLNDTEFGRLVRAALRYKATGAEPVELGREALLWDGMRLDIDRDNDAYSKLVKTRSEAGKRGAESRWQTKNGDGKNGKCHSCDGKNGQDKDKDKDKDKDNLPPISPSGGKRFVPPSLDEVRDYCRERGKGVDPVAFMDFYTSNGWKVGRNPMKDWKAAVRTWETRRKEGAGDDYWSKL